MGGRVDAAVIGLGAMGIHHLRILSQLEQIKNLSGVEVSEERRKEVAKEFPQAALYSSMEELLHNQRPVFVSIATLGPTHIDLAQRALDADARFILIEKPAGISVASIRALDERAKKAKACIGINHSRRACHDYQNIQPWIEKIGGIRGFVLLSGGGRLGSVGSHYFDTMRMISSSNFTAVNGYLDPAYVGDHKGRDIWDPGGVGTLEMTDGMRVLVDLTDDLGFPPLLIVYGPWGRLLLNENAKIWVCEARSNADRTNRLGQYGTPLIREDIPLRDPLDLVVHTKKMMEAVLTNNSLCTLEDGAAAVEAIVGFHLSHAKRTKILLPLNSKDALTVVKIT